MKKIILWILLIIVLGFITLVFWDYRQSSISTDDAHLNAEVVQVISHVSGPVSHVYVYDNQYVTQHQVLFDIGDETHVMSPIAGFVENMTLKTGKKVYANRPLFDVVSNAYYWIETNFNETDKALIRPGQRITVLTDIYADEPLRGVIESLSADGRRMRVQILNPPTDRPLRIGTSAIVNIYVNTR